MPTGLSTSDYISDRIHGLYIISDWQRALTVLRTSIVTFVDDTLSLSIVDVFSSGS